MSRILVADSINKIGEKIMVSGWINTRRDHGKIVFIDLRDRSGLLQVVLTPTLAENLRVEDVITITGTVTARPDKLVNPKLSTGTVELQAETVTVLSSASELPFDMSKETLDLELPTLLDYRGLTLRHPRVKAIFKVQEVVIDSFRKALQAKDFLEFQSPNIIASVPEGGTEVFKLDYYGHPAYLSQSPQLYKSLLVSSFERVFSVNKVFRAEPSVTTRHISEVVSLDAEMGFIENWEETMDMAEYVIKFILHEVKSHCQKELDLFSVDIPQVADKIPRLKLREIQQIIMDRTGRDCRQEKDLAPEDEREICKYTAEHFGSDLVFVTHFLTAKKPFYVAEDSSDPEYAFSMDLLGRGVEWLSGGQRIHQYDKLLQKAKAWGLNPNDIDLYLQGFKYGCPPLGGFAFGAERITMHILNLKNIREAVMFPRDMERIDTRFSVQKNSDNQKSAYENIIEKLNTAHIDYQHFEHQPVFTSEDSAKVRGTSVHQGAKALVMQGDNKLLLYVLPADFKADLDKIKTDLGLSKLAMASKETVSAKIGLEVGCIPPFGSVINLPTFVDRRLSENEEIAFNAGRHDRSIKMKYSDFIRLENPKII